MPTKARSRSAKKPATTRSGGCNSKAVIQNPCHEIVLPEVHEVEIQSLPDVQARIASQIQSLMLAEDQKVMDQIVSLALSDAEKINQTIMSLTKQLMEPSTPGFSTDDCLLVDSRLVYFFYQLMRDYLDPGTVDRLVKSCETQGMPVQVMNKSLLESTKNILIRLLK